MLSLAVKRDNGAWCALAGKHWIQAGNLRQAMELSRRFVMYGIDFLIDYLDDAKLTPSQLAEVRSILDGIVHTIKTEHKVEIDTRWRESMSDAMGKASRGEV